MQSISKSHKDSDFDFRKKMLNKEELSFEYEKMPVNDELASYADSQKSIEELNIADDRMDTESKQFFNKLSRELPIFTEGLHSQSDPTCMDNPLAPWY